MITFYISPEHYESHVDKKKATVGSKKTGMYMRKVPVLLLSWWHLVLRYPNCISLKAGQYHEYGMHKVPLYMKIIIPLFDFSIN